MLRPSPKLTLAAICLDQRAGPVGDRLPRHIELHRHVAAGDVEADAADRDVLLVGDHAADRLRIAEVAVGAQHAADHAAVLMQRTICSLVRSSCSPKIFTSGMACSCAVS